MISCHSGQLSCRIAGLFDAQKELQRLSKQQVKLEKELQGISGRLNNQKFIQNAKPEVVAEARQQATELQEKLKLVQEKQQQLQQLQ